MQPSAHCKMSISEIKHNVKSTENSNYIKCFLLFDHKNIWVVWVLTEVCVLSKELMISLPLFLHHVHPSHCSGAHEQPCDLASEGLFPQRDSLESDPPCPAWNLHPGARGGTGMDWMLQSTNTMSLPKQEAEPPRPYQGTDNLLFEGFFSVISGTFTSA